MAKSITIALLIVAAGLAAGLDPAAADTIDDIEPTAHIGTDHEAQIQIWFHASDPALTPLLPAGWELSPVADGPAAGANVSVTLIESISAMVGAPQRAEAPGDRSVMVAIPARSQWTGQEAAIAIGGYAADADGAPGFFRAYQPGAITLDRTETGAARVDESWTVDGADGARLEVGLTWRRDEPSIVPARRVTVSGFDASVWRSDRGPEAVEVLFSQAAGVDRTDLQLVVDALFDGTQTLVGILSIRSYYRSFSP